MAVDVPAGVADGMELRVGGAGNAGRADGPPGDLFVGIRVEPSLAFERRGQDLSAILDLSMTQVTLGADVEVETLDGVEHIRIEPGTGSGTVIRLRGKGVPNLNRRGRGDLYVTVHVVTPTELSREERKLFEQIAELRGEETSKREPGTATSGGPTRESLGFAACPMIAFDAECIFCRIAAREIPAEILHVSDTVVAFRDLNPQAPVHILLIPKEHIASIADVEERHGGPARRPHPGGHASGEGRGHRRRRLASGLQRRPRRRADRLPPALPPARRPSHDLAARVEPV